MSAGRFNACHHGNPSCQWVCDLYTSRRHRAHRMNSYDHINVQQSYDYLMNDDKWRHLWEHRRHLRQAMGTDTRVVVVTHRGGGQTGSRGQLLKHVLHVYSIDQGRTQRHGWQIKMSRACPQSQQFYTSLIIEFYIKRTHYWYCPNKR